ncbi:ferrous iron transport protein B [Thermodesulfitimonas autotrophica]|uniref:Ferrous iron transport protein B n=1 Tax=Thermodesulfitimonas autotrophica TaxID=1894989 RepID=A0A3N5ACG7_9THEO|nr:ferrous iron transport protein B [Thermodesulfitimonas autotrophica]RPF42566.1 ferrous iron transport protein B [Thermodesulfitimonas autotrophica]
MAAARTEKAASGVPAGQAAKAKFKEAARVTVALAGNPNVGKSCIFNNLTGARQHVGNWPGVTVEKKEGQMLYAGEAVRVVDLPGVYGLGAFSEDEIIARDYILAGEADVIINIVDATNLERNLYLTVELLEMGANLVVALNLMDEAAGRGLKIDVPKLGALLGVPVVPTVAPKKQGMEELVAAALKRAREGSPQPLAVPYGREVEAELARLETALAAYAAAVAGLPRRWVAVKLLEGDELVRRRFERYPALLKLVEESAARLAALTGEDAAALVAEGRYGFIAGLVRETVSRQKTAAEKLTLSDKIDQVVTHRLLGIPIFLGAMWLLFKFTFALGGPLVGYTEAFFEWLGGRAAAIPNPVLASLVKDGIIGGVGSVLVFIPPIFLLFLGLSFLEDSGYMARAAYVMDRLMHALGLHGKSFIPLLIGFGCNVPAIMATRTLENRRDRLITLLVAPLMSCAARLPVYVLFAGAFFGARQGLVVFSLYLLGIILAVLMGMLFKVTLFKGEQAPFVMELPPYRLPTFKGTLIHMWERGAAFVKKAGTVIFGVVVLVWLLSNVPWGAPVEQSVIARLGHLLAPIYAPCGFGHWEAAVALFFGILAKEAVVGTLGTVYGVEEAGLQAAVQHHFTPLAAYAFMALTLLYIPCVATIGAIRREAGWGWAAFATAYTLALGWLVACLIFQVGRLLGLG